MQIFFGCFFRWWKISFLLSFYSTSGISLKSLQNIAFFWDLFSEVRGVWVFALGSAKGFCRAKFWAKFPFWRGGSSGRSFSRSLQRSFTKFSGLFCLDIQSKQKLQQNFSPKFPWLCTATLEKSQGKWRGSAGDPCPRLCLLQKKFMLLVGRPS